MWPRWNCSIVLYAISEKLRELLVVILICIYLGEFRKGGSFHFALNEANRRFYLLSLRETTICITINQLQKCHSAPILDMMMMLTNGNQKRKARQ